jgi:WD40 repeat protein/serine/threonine protein kinase/tetratricopeptide (TPR) repeat protein
MKEREIFDAALAIADPDERDAFLNRACNGDPGLKEHLERLLEMERRLGRFLESPESPPTMDLDSSRLAEGPGTIIGPYKLREQIGEGGMGVVYVAEQTHPVRRKVALKIIKPGMDTRQVVARFEAERQALAMMDHPNIARVHDGGATESGRPYFVMELVRGIPITDYCDRERLSIKERLDLFVQVCRSVQHAHQKGIIHRDLKPTNILVTVIDGVAVPKVIDFGVAKATGPSLTERTVYTAFHQFVGTPLYMSPEQADLSGMDVDTRSDIYSLGVLLYELLTGTTPFDQATFRMAAFDELRRIIREHEPPRPSTRLSSLGATRATVSANRRADARHLDRTIRGELDWIVMKALDKDRRRRYETANDFAADVTRYLSNQPVEACPPSVWYRLGKFSRRNRLVLTAAAAITLILILGTAVSAWQAIRATRAEGLVSTALAVSRAQTATAEALRHQAQNAAEDGRQRQVRLNVEQGVRLINGGDLTGSLPYFVEALRLDENDPARAEDHRLRLGMLLAQCPKPAHIWFHDQPTGHVQLRPDGRAVAIASGDGTITIRDVETGQPIGPILRHGNWVSSLNFSPDGHRIATGGSDQSVRIWDLATGREVVPPLEHRDRVHFVLFSPDGSLLLTGRPFRIWDAATGRPVSDWVPTHNLALACFSPDSRRVALPGVDPSFLIYDAKTGRPISPPMTQNHSVTIHPVHSFSPDGRRIVTGCLDGNVRIWDTTTGKLAVPAMKHMTYTGARFSPDGRWLLSRSWAGDDSVRVWDAATGAPRCDPMRHPAAVILAEFSPDGTRVVTTGGDRAVRVWDTATGRLLLPPLWHPAPLTMIQIGPDGRHVLSVSVDGTVRLWDLAGASPDGPRLQTLRETSLAGFSPDGHLLITTGTGGAVRVWDVVTGSPVGSAMLHPADWLADVQVSPDGRSLATLTGRGSHRVDAWVWDLATRRVKLGPLMIHRVAESLGHVTGARIAWSPDGRRLATSVSWRQSDPPQNTKVVQVWEAQTGIPVTPPRMHETGVYNLDFSPDGQSLLSTGGNDIEANWHGEARILDASTATLRFPPIITLHPRAAARFSPDGGRLVTATSEGGARVWDAPTGRPLTPPLRHFVNVSDTFFSPDGRLVVTVSDALRLWDATSGRMVLPPLLFSLPLNSAVISPDGRRLLVMCGPGAAFAQVLDVATGWPVTPPLWREGSIPDALFSPDGRRVVTTSGGGGALLWDLKPDERPWDDLVRMTQVLSGTRVDETGTAKPISTSELREAYEVLLRKAPGTFLATPQQVRSWHHEQAQVCEVAGAWKIVVKHLDRLIEDGPSVDVLGVRRGIAHAELGHWQQAASDLDVRRLAPHDEISIWYFAALVHLAGGDRDGYRAACAGMIQHLGGADASGEPAEFTAWTSALAPDGVENLAPALALAERLHAEEPKDTMAATTLGALLYRAGRFSEAVARLDAAEQLPEDRRISPIYGQLFLAMAHHRLGHADEAKHRLDRAAVAIDKAFTDHGRGTEPLQLQRRLTLTLLRAEAAALLGVTDDPKSAGKKDEKAVDNADDRRTKGPVPKPAARLGLADRPADVFARP